MPVGSHGIAHGDSHGVAHEDAHGDAHGPEPGNVQGYSPPADPQKGKALHQIEIV